MFGSTILEVAIGMFFLFFILSLILSAVRETIEAFMQKRAWHLAQGIKELLDDESDGTLTTRLYSHPLIAGLFRNKKTEKVSDTLDGKRLLNTGKNLPAYIPARNFASALLDSIAHGRLLTDGPNAISSDAVTSQKLRQAIGKISGHENLKNALLVAIDEANGDLALARANLAAWYDSSMDRVSAWYRKETQYILLIMGFAIAVLFNINAFGVAAHLYQDDSARAIIIAQAEASSTSAVPLCSSEENLSQLDCLSQEVEDLGYPMGWSDELPLTSLSDPEFLLSWSFLSSLTGWALTAFALTLGAPFWFDTLNKFMVIRSTVKPHEKSPEESSEDRQKDVLLKAWMNPALSQGSGQLPPPQTSSGSTEEPKKDQG